MKHLLPLIFLLLFLVHPFLSGQTPPTALEIVAPETLVIGRVGQPYQYTIKTTGGTTPFVWTTEGTLPPGLTLQNPTTRTTEGELIGTPTTASEYTFTVTVTDANQQSVSKLLKVKIQHIYGPYAVPEAVTICQMDLTQTPPAPAIDEVLRVPRCFVVPTAVSDSMTKFMVSQTNGLDTDGNVVYKYASWWDYVIKFFLNKLVLPTLEEFPPPELATAKANAEAAAAAVDATKITILQVDPSVVK